MRCRKVTERTAPYDSTDSDPRTTNPQWAAQHEGLKDPDDATECARERIGAPSLPPRKVSARSMPVCSQVRVLDRQKARPGAYRKARRTGHSFALVRLTLDARISLTCACPQRIAGSARAAATEDPSKPNTAAYGSCTLTCSSERPSVLITSAVCSPRPGTPRICNVHQMGACPTVAPCSIGLAAGGASR